MIPSTRRWSQFVLLPHMAKLRSFLFAAKHVCLWQRQLQMHTLIKQINEQNDT